MHKALLCTEHASIWGDRCGTMLGCGSAQLPLHSSSLQQWFLLSGLMQILQWLRRSTIRKYLWLWNAKLHLTGLCISVKTLSKRHRLRNSISIHFPGGHWQAKGTKMTRQAQKAFLCESFPDNRSKFDVVKEVKTREKRDRMGVP